MMKLALFVSLNKTLKYLSEKAGLDPTHISTHSLRHGGTTFLQSIEHEFLLLFNTGLVWDIPSWLAFNFGHLKVLFELLQTAVSPGNSRAVICLFPHLKMRIPKEKVRI